MSDISNQDDIIDSRDVIDRIDELQGERTELVDALDEAEEDCELAAELALRDWDEANLAELKSLETFADEAEGYCEDWRHGASLIRESYFPDYVEELLDDCGYLPKDLPSYIVIDWPATARNIRMDYTDVEFDGVTYLVR